MNFTEILMAASIMFEGSIVFKSLKFKLKKFNCKSLPAYLYDRWV